MAIDKAEILRLRREGKSIFDIAHAVRCSGRTVSNALKAAGVSTGQRKFFVSRELMTTLWLSDKPLMEIAKELGCSQATVSKIAKGYGLPRKVVVPKEVETDPTPAEIEERKAEIKRRHLEAKRREDPDVTRIRVWRESVAGGVA